jgi:hypothetical protein
MRALLIALLLSLFVPQAPAMAAECEGQTALVMENHDTMAGHHSGMKPADRQQAGPHLCLGCATPVPDLAVPLIDVFYAQLPPVGPASRGLLFESGPPETPPPRPVR